MRHVENARDRVAFDQVPIDRGVVERSDERRGLSRRHLSYQPLTHGVVTIGDCIDVEHEPRGMLSVHEAGRLADGSLRTTFVDGNLALDDDLSVGGNQNVRGLAAHHRDRLAAQSAGHL